MVAIFDSNSYTEESPTTINKDIHVDSTNMEISDEDGLDHEEDVNVQHVEQYLNDIRVAVKAAVDKSEEAMQLAKTTSTSLHNNVIQHIVNISNMQREHNTAIASTRLQIDALQTKHSTHEEAQVSYC